MPAGWQKAVGFGAPADRVTLYEDDVGCYEGACGDEEGVVAVGEDMVCVHAFGR